MSLLPYLVVAGLAIAVPCFVGAHSTRVTVAQVLCLLAAMTLVGVLTASGRDPDVSGSDVVIGSLLAAVVATGVPLALYYWLGRWLGDRVKTLVVVVVISAVPLFYFVGISWLIVAAYVDCPPDAYECPV